jgi:hypothetical protein
MLPAKRIEALPRCLEFRKPAAFLLNQVVLDSTDGLCSFKNAFPIGDALSE